MTKALRPVAVALALSGCGGTETSAFVLSGDVRVDQPIDLVPLVRAARIPGDLIISGDAASGDLRVDGLVSILGDVVLENPADGTTIAFPRLETIGGRLRVDDGGAVRMELPALTRVASIEVRRASLSLFAGALQLVEGDIDFEDVELGTLELPVLREVGGDIELYRVEGSLSWRLAELVAIGGHLRIRSVGSFALELPSLATIGGDLVVDASEGRLSLSSLSAIGGDLVVREAVLSFELPRLETVGRRIELRDLALSAPQVELSLPALRRVNRTLRIARVSGLEGVSLPSLERVERDLQFEGLPGLSRLALDALSGLGGSLSLVEAGALEASAPELVEIGGSLEVSRSIGLNLMVPKLETITGSFRIEDTPVSALEVSQMGTVGRDLVLTGLGTNPLEIDALALSAVGGDLSIEAAGALRVGRFPMLRSVGRQTDGVPNGSLLIRANPNLSELALDELVSVELVLDVRDNPSLDGEAIERSLEQVVARRTTICGNGGQPACAPP